VLANKVAIANIEVLSILPIYLKNDSFQFNKSKQVKVNMSPSNYIAVKAVHEPFWTIQIQMDKEEDVKLVRNQRLFFYNPDDEMFPFGFIRPVASVRISAIIAALEKKQLVYEKRVFVYDPEAEEYICADQLASALAF
jgi:hypothetical protein